MDIAVLMAAAVTNSDPEHRRLLDAAREEFVTHGFRRTSVGDIARRAKVSRPTVYRRLGDKDQIVRAVTLAEVMDFLLGIRHDVLAKPSPGDRAVEAFTRGIVACHGNPLMSAILKFEPETLSSLATPENSGWMQTLRSAVASVLVGPDYPDDAALRAAELMLRITISLLVAPTEFLPVETEAQARWFANTYFVPLIEAAANPVPSP